MDAAVPALPLSASSLSHIQWRATEWLLAMGPLTRANVMDYFEMSPFWDRKSNNAELRMQTQWSREREDPKMVEEKLKKMEGVEFWLREGGGKGLWVIEKRIRASENDARTIAVYYVLNDSVYQGPSLYSVLNERLLTSLHALSSSLTLLQSHAPKWTPETLYNWDIRPPPASTMGSLGKRPREEDENDENHVDGEDGPTSPGEAEEEERDGFNPLLFRAIQLVAPSEEKAGEA